MRNAILASALVVAFFGCHSFDIDAIKRVNPGMAAKGVTELLGQPYAKAYWKSDRRLIDRSESWPILERQWNEVWTYVKSNFLGGRTTVKIFFQDFVVVAVFVEE